MTFVNNGNGTATLAGTPAAHGGTYPLTITASNGVGAPASQSFTLTVNQAPAITSATSDDVPDRRGRHVHGHVDGLPDRRAHEHRRAARGRDVLDNGNGTATLAGTPGAGTGGTYPLTITAPTASARPRRRASRSPSIRRRLHECGGDDLHRRCSPARSR